MDFYFLFLPILLLIVYFIGTVPTGVLIRASLSKILSKEQADATTGLEKAGRYIGYLERILIITFILVDQWVAIGFLFTAKSIFRFEESKTGKAEYFLLGTLFSFTGGILLGIVGKFVLTFGW